MDWHGCAWGMWWVEEGIKGKGDRGHGDEPLEDDIEEGSISGKDMERNGIDVSS
jgi:hypothetical protein